MSWPACCCSAYYREPTILANRACRETGRQAFAFYTQVASAIPAVVAPRCLDAHCDDAIMRWPWPLPPTTEQCPEEVGRATDRPGDHLSSEHRTLYDRLLDAARRLLSHTRQGDAHEPLPGARDTNGPSLSSATHPAAASKNSACCPMRMLTRTRYPCYFDSVFRSSAIRLSSAPYH